MASTCAVRKEVSCLDYLRKLCSEREYAPSDIYKKALARAENEEEALKMVEALTQEGYLSALRFATAFARDKSAIAGWGPVKIRFMLRSKGIDDDTIKAALGQVDDERADARLIKLMEAKYKSLTGDPQVKIKLLKFALSRGYDYETVSGIVTDLCRGNSCI